MVTFAPPKRLVIGLSFALIFSFNAQSQNKGIAINSNFEDPHPSAVLDVRSDNQGLLIPRMGTSARLNIAEPANALLVYDTDQSGFYFYNGTTNQWVQIGSGGDGNGGGNNGGGDGFWTQTALGDGIYTDNNVGIGATTIDAWSLFGGVPSRLITFQATGTPVNKTIALSLLSRGNSSANLYFGNDQERFAGLSAYGGNLVLLSASGQTEDGLSPRIFLEANTGEVGVGTNQPRAVLDIQSTSSGVIVPRLPQEGDVTSPQDGMIIYNTTTGKFQGYANGTWVDLH